MTFLSKGGDLFFLRWLSILCTASGFVIMASTAISEPHSGQISGRLSPSMATPTLMHPCMSGLLHMSYVVIIKEKERSFPAEKK